MSSATTMQQVGRTLFKTILRLHRGLPNDVRQLGDAYVRDEFRRHIKCPEAEAALFLKEWSDYAHRLNEQLTAEGEKRLGKDIDPKALDYMRDDQVSQLYELMKSATKDGEDNSESPDKNRCA